MQYFLESEYSPATAQEAHTHIIPVPLERSVSYGSGTQHGPSAILEASQQLEAWDGYGFPGEAGIHTQEPVPCPHDERIETILDNICARTEYALACNAVPMLLGGEHTVSYGGVKAVAKHYAELGIIHFDAHADLRDEYEGSKFSHACVLRRCYEDFALPLIQFGTREVSYEEHCYRQEKGILAYDAKALAHNCRIEIPANFPRNVYVTFDVDAFDASLMPATGTPAPGGLFWQQSIDILEHCLQGRRIVGFDVVELAPIAGLHHADFTATKMVYTLMGLEQRLSKEKK